MKQYVQECQRYLRENHELDAHGENHDIVAVAHQLRYQEVCQHNIHLVKVLNGCFLWSFNDNPYIVTTNILSVNNFYDFSIYATNCACICITI